MIHTQDADFTLICADVMDGLRSLEDGSVHCVVTSPPYWGLRDYSTDGQLGLEATPDLYVARIVEVFREVWRVLRDDGTCWVNLGDSYATGGNGVSVQETDRDAAARRKVGYKDSGRSTGQHGGWENRASQGKGTAVGGLKPKDLVGIPWRVAFALQQPWERHVVAEATDRAWMAGLVDGEGCVSVVAVQPTTGLNESHSMRLQIRMADVEAVERVVAVTGMSNVTYDLDTGQGARLAQQWKISGDKAADVLADIYPFLTVKRRQAIVGWNIQRLKDGIVTRRGQPIPAENMEKRRLLHDVLRKLNQREPVDIPSWCREPQFVTEPGWYLRSDVVWSKPNPMPESVTDRPTKAHEYVFLLSKQPRYFFDQEAVREPHTTAERNGDRRSYAPGSASSMRDGEHQAMTGSFAGLPLNAAGRNIRSVWEIATQPYPEAHFATYPEELVRRCVLAGTSERGCCPVCGKPWERETETPQNGKPDPNAVKAHGGLGNNLGGGRHQAWRDQNPVRTLGWRPGCNHGEAVDCPDCSTREEQLRCKTCLSTGEVTKPSEPIPCTVLDPFLGSGTTAYVARKHGRRSVGIELNPAYADLAARRMQQQSLLV